MALKIRRGLEEDRETITPAEGELLYTTDEKKLYIGDGATAGGNAVDTLGTVAVSDLTDVDLTGLADNDILIYNNASGTWFPESLPSEFSLNAKEEDGSPDISGVNTLVFPNGYLTDNGGGNVSVAYPAPYSLTVEEVDGTPSVSGVTKIVVTNGSLTDTSTGTVILDFGGGGSGDVATDTIWDAKGDLAGGTGANTAAKLTVGTDGQVLTADAAQTTGLKWAAAGMTNPMTTAGDIIIGGVDGAPARLEAGTEDYVLTMGATAPEWAEATGGGSSGDYPYQVMIPFSNPSASSGTVTVSADNTIFGAYRVFTSAQNNYLEYPVLLAAGTWKVNFYSTRGTDRSIITISIDGSDVGTVDAYGSTQINTPYTLGSITIATSGIKLLRFTAATKNASSSGYIMMLYVVSMTRTGA